LDIKDAAASYAVIILPGFNRLDSKALTAVLKQRIPSFRNFRFASPEEMARVAPGIEPGKMPPIGRPIFPSITYTYIDRALCAHNKVGFNAAHFEKSIIMPTAELLEIVPHDCLIDCSLEPSRV
jgi:prolyl-tRNA editing enzyme YbaK/EbsC (Cys-tRNA(Pro) deacylase)